MLKGSLLAFTHMAIFKEIHFIKAKEPYITNKIYCILIYPFDKHLLNAYYVLHIVTGVWIHKYPKSLSSFLQDNATFLELNLCIKICLKIQPHILTFIPFV